MGKNARPAHLDPNGIELLDLLFPLQIFGLLVELPGARLAKDWTLCQRTPTMAISPTPTSGMYLLSVAANRA